MGNTKETIVWLDYLSQVQAIWRYRHEIRAEVLVPFKWYLKTIAEHEAWPKPV